jgi:hypothetical protein
VQAIFDEYQERLQAALKYNERLEGYTTKIFVEKNISYVIVQFENNSNAKYL